MQNLVNRLRHLLCNHNYGGDLSSDEERPPYEVRAFTLLAQHADPSAAHFLAQYDLTLHD